MTISDEQREFIDTCVFEHDGNVARTAAALGIPPNTYRKWFEDALFDAEMQRTQYIRLRSLGFDRFTLAIKLMSVINANLADVAHIEDISQLGELPPSISYAIQSFKRTFDVEAGDVTIEIKHHDKLKALMKAIESTAPSLFADAAMLGGETDKRLEGVTLELPYEVLEERGLLRKPSEPVRTDWREGSVQDEIDGVDTALEAKMDDWLNE